MTPGRNDPCPCGSGKKYKKCCLGKTEPVATPRGAEPVERRFFSPVCSYYTQAALEEALKPGGMVKIHPYVLIKIRDDPKLLATAEPEYRARILRMWRASGLAGMPTEEIETRLALIGVPFDRASFIEETKHHPSAWSIAETWGAPLVGLSRADGDFLGLAACELWRRLCPNPASLEMLDDWLCEGYALVAEKKRTEALAVWWRLWGALRPRLTPEIKNLNDAGEQLFPRMSQCLSNWSTDFRLEALNGALEDARCGELGIHFIREMQESLPEEEDDLSCSGDLATLLFQLRRDSEAEERCRSLIRSHPDQAIGYVTLADGWLRPFRERPSDTQALRRAIRLLEDALAYPVKDPEDFDVPRRLAEARQLLSKTGA